MLAREPCSRDPADRRSRRSDGARPATRRSTRVSEPRRPGADVPAHRTPACGGHGKPTRRGRAGRDGRAGDPTATTERTVDHTPPERVAVRPGMVRGVPGSPRPSSAGVWATSIGRKTRPFGVRRRPDGGVRTPASELHVDQDELGRPTAAAIAISGSSSISAASPVVIALVVHGDVAVDHVEVDAAAVAERVRRRRRRGRGARRTRARPDGRGPRRRRRR